MNRRDFGKLLEELHRELRQSIEDVKKDLAHAKGLKTQLNNYFNQTQEIINQITNDETGVEVYHEHIKEISKSIEEIKTNAETHLTSIATSLESVKSNVTEMETAYESFTEVNEKITDEEDGLEAVLESAKNTEAEIANLKTNAETHLTSIATSLESVKSNVTEMETAYESFTEVNEKITDEEDGLEAVLESANSTKSDIEAVKVSADTIYKEIRKFRDEAANYSNEMGGLKKAASQTLEKITKNHEETEDLKAKIHAIFKISSQDAHANYFAERRNKLFWVSIAWLGIFITFLAITVVLGIIFIAPLAEIVGNEEVVATRVTLEAFLIRLGIVTPTLLASIYALNQFAHDRRLYEKYAFKAVTMLSIESSVETLSRSLQNNSKLNEKEDRIIDFAVNTFESIYAEPVEPRREGIIMRGGNKILELSTEINQSVGDIKKDVDKLAQNNSE